MYDVNCIARRCKHNKTDGILGGCFFMPPSLDARGVCIDYEEEE